MAVPAPDGLTQRVRGDPRPRCRGVPDRPGRGDRPGRQALPAGDHGAGDQLGHADRVAGRARRAPHGAMAPRRRAVANAPPHTDGLRRRSCPAADRPVHGRRGTGETGVRAGVRLRPHPGHLGVHRQGLCPGCLPGARRRHRGMAHPDHRHAARVRVRPGDGPHPDARRRDPILRPVLDRAWLAANLRGGQTPPRVDGPPLAALARPWPVPRPPLDPLPAAQRADPEGAHVRALGRARGGAHDITGGNPTSACGRCGARPGTSPIPS